MLGTKLNINLDRRIIAHQRFNGLAFASDVPTVKEDVTHLAEVVPDDQPAIGNFDDDELDYLTSITPPPYSPRSDWSGVRNQLIAG